MIPKNRPRSACSSREAESVSRVRTRPRKRKRPPNSKFPTDFCMATKTQPTISRHGTRKNAIALVRAPRRRQRKISPQRPQVGKLFPDGHPRFDGFVAFDHHQTRPTSLKGARERGRAAGPRGQAGATRPRHSRALLKFDADPLRPR